MSAAPIDDRCMLAVDLGTSGCKTALVSLEGRVIAWAFEPVQTQVLPGGGAEQVPDDWWQGFMRSARKVLADSGVAAARVVGVCCSTQGEGTVAVDRQGNAIGNAMLWMDMRGAEILRRHVRGLINVAGYDAFKLLRWIRLTGGAPALSGKDPAAHMLYLRERRADIYERTYKFLGVPDYLLLRLTGRFVASYDSILTSWVTDNRDSARVRYDDGLLRLSGIGHDKFPDIVPCTEVVGTLLSTVASELGLSTRTPVVAGSIDTTASAIGSGAVADGEAHLYIGTSSWVAAHVPYKKTDVSAGMASVPCAIPGRYLMTAMQTTAGGNLTYLRDRILYHKDELLAEAQQPDVYKILDRIAARVPAGSRGLIYTPWLFGERCPVEDKNLRAGLFNLSLEHSREDIIRAFLEGVALNTRWMMKPVGRFLGKPVDTLTIVGGGGASDLWCQIFADVLNVRIRQPYEPLQANAIGAAAICAVGLGLTKFEEWSGRMECKAEYLPDPASREVLDRHFDTFQELHQRLAPLYRRLNAADEASKGVAHMSRYLKHQRLVLDACLRLADRGYLAGIGGNVAARIDEQMFAVTPSAADYYTMQPADICILRLHTLEVVEGSRQPSVESALHARMFRFRNDAFASVHTHQPIASAVALLNLPIELRDVAQRDALGPRIEIVPYGPSGTGLLVRALAGRLRKDINAYLLRNHGLICAGRTMEEATANVEHVERAAAAFLRSAIEALPASRTNPSVTALALSALN